MGSLFSQGGSTSRSSLSPEQRPLLEPLAEFALRGLEQEVPGYERLLRELKRSGTRQARRTTERMFLEGLLAPSLRAYDEQIAPRINSQFAGLGGSLSSRRTQTLADTLQGITENAQNQIATQLPAIHAFPLEQTLRRISGASALEGYRTQPFASALQFALQPTQQAVSKAPGAGWGLLDTALGFGAFGLGAGFFGGGSGGQGLGYTNNPAQTGTQTMWPGGSW